MRLRLKPDNPRLVRTFEIKHGRELLPLYEIPASILQLQGATRGFLGHRCPRLLVDSV